MTQKSTIQTENTTEIATHSDWHEAYTSTAAALGASWCDFVGERFHAYAHIIDDVSHCHDLNEAWKMQADFGQQTFKAYSDQAAKVSGLMMQATKGNGSNAKH